MAGGNSLDAAIITKDVKEPKDNSNNNGGGGGGGGGNNGSWYTTSGGGISSKPDVKGMQANLNNINNTYDLAADNIKDTLNKGIKVNKQQRTANAKQLLMKNNQINRKSNWQPNQQKEQSTYSALRRTMGNAAYGSGLADLNEGMARYDDMQDVELINTWKDNQNAAYNNWYQANADLIADYNEKIIDADNKFSTLYTDYLNNIASIEPRLAKKAYKVGKGEISQKVEGTNKSLSLKTRGQHSSGKDLLTNKASVQNPNIPNSARGATDYIRGTNEGYRSNIIDNGEVNLAGAANKEAFKEEVGTVKNEAGASAQKQEQNQRASLVNKQSNKTVKLISSGIKATSKKTTSKKKTINGSLKKTVQKTAKKNSNKKTTKNNKTIGSGIKTTGKKTAKNNKTIGSGIITTGKKTTKKNSTKSISKKKK